MIKKIAKSILTGILRKRRSFLYSLAFDCMREGVASATIITLKLKRDTILGRRGDEIVIPLDTSILPVVLENGSWQEDEIDFARRNTSHSNSYCVMDLGSNVGLFARQIYNSGIEIDRCFCVEPSRQNFVCLSHNTSSYDNVETYNFALGEKNMSGPLYMDYDNQGNHSLIKDAMRGRRHSAECTRVRATDEFFTSIYPKLEGKKIIWKSDTQGYDEIIVSLVPPEVWGKVDVAIIELMRINKPKYDKNEFRKRISKFPNIAIEHKRCRSVEDVLDFLDREDYANENLYLWQ